MTSERESVQRLLRLLATSGSALMLVVIFSSAYLRLTQAGLSCADWPACYGQIEANATITTGVRVARLAHRVAAGAVGAVLLGLLLIGATQRPVLKRQTGIAAAGLLVAGTLAALGAQFSASAPSAQLPAVVLGNLTGGFALLALLWWLRLSTLTPRPLPRAPSTRLKLGAAVALLAVIGQIALGATVSAKFAALACPAFPDCGAGWPEGALLASLDLSQELAIGADGTIVRPSTLAALHWVHRLGALIVFMLGAGVALPLIRMGATARQLGTLLALLLLAQAELGVTAVFASMPLQIVLAHNMVAALLLVTLVTASWRVYAGEREGP